MQIALLIDCENAQPDSIDGILGELAAKGAINPPRVRELEESVGLGGETGSDCDFTPLVLKLLSKGKTVIGFGETKTPGPFVRACSEFIHTDSFKEPSVENPLPSGTTRKTNNELRGDTELRTYCARPSRA